jgi:hypothetical protein
VDFVALYPSHGLFNTKLQNKNMNLFQSFANSIKDAPKKILMNCARSVRWAAPSALLLLASCGGGDAGISLLLPSCPKTINPVEALAKVNAVRSVARKCGDVAYPAAAPLAWSDALYTAAAAHAEDMANNNNFSHTGSDGSSPGQRITASGYGPLTYYGENVGAGYGSIDDVIKSWLNSPDHCKNIMSDQYRDYAIACSGNEKSERGTYWTQDFGSHQ